MKHSVQRRLLVVAPQEGKDEKVAIKEVHEVLLKNWTQVRV